MRPRTISCFLLFFVLAVGSCFSQEQKDTSVLGRISYSGELSPKICFAVYRDGTYFLSKRVSMFIPLGPDNAPDADETVQGQLSDEQLAKVTTMLGAMDFKSPEGGIVLESAEWFVAEVRTDHEIHRYRWLNADGLNPFPKSVADIVSWLHDFKAKGSAKISLRGLSDVAVCPREGPRPLQPVIAGLSPGIR